MVGNYVPRPISSTRFLPIQVMESVCTPTDVYLSESCEEIMSYRDQLSKCPMLLPLRLNIEEAIGQGQFGQIHRGYMTGEEKREVMIHTVRSWLHCCFYFILCVSNG